jgi:hypothetical protein
MFQADGEQLWRFWFGVLVVLRRALVASTLSALVHCDFIISSRPALQRLMQVKVCREA